MPPITTTFPAGVALLLSCVTVLAQQAEPTSQEVASEGNEAQTSQFRTFEPSEDEWETFRSAGKISHQGGEAVYNATCAGCHMPDAQGAVGAGMYPALAGNELLSEPSYPIYLILEGQKAMPPLGGLLDDQQVADVVNYIRSNFGNDFVEEFGEATAENVGATRQ
jgi:mono/diheme cytochrome c family protein